MATIPQGFIFDWRHVEAASDLDRLKLVFSAIPDEPLMKILEAARGRGRDDYPVRAIWNSILAGVVFQHPTIESLRRELCRNGQLRQLCGFDPLAGESAVPTPWAYTHFLESLIEQEPLVREMFHSLVESLRSEIPDLGRLLAQDGKALPSFGKPHGRSHVQEAQATSEQQGSRAVAGGDVRKSDHSVQGHAQEKGNKDNSAPAPGAMEKPDRRRENDADWGRKTYRGAHADGTKWEKVVQWFGFKVHLLVDSAHEIPINYEITKASVSDMNRMLPLVEETQKLHPEMIGQAEELSADKGYDSTENCQELYDRYGIAPIIDKRADWKDGDKTRLIEPEKVDNIVYDVKGTVQCVCPKTGEVRPMAPWGFEPDRGTLKYRCPAGALGVSCQGRAECPGAATQYGRVVRIKIENDRRMFTPIPRDSDTWQRGYNRRTAVERVNSRIDNLLGFEHHTIRGLEKMETRFGIAMVVMLAMALGRIRADQREQLRSLVGPVRRAA